MKEAIRRIKPVDLFMIILFVVQVTVLTLAIANRVSILTNQKEIKVNQQRIECMRLEQEPIAE